MNIVYSCIGLPKYEYKYWAEHWPIIVDNLIAGSSQRPGQKLVFCDNLYAYQTGSTISTSSPTWKASTKGKPAIRALLRQKFQERINQNPSSVTIVGGADFFGPLATKACFLGDTFTRAIVEGINPPQCIGSADKVHDFCYVPDFSKALYIASVNEEAYGKFWICPHAIHGKTLNDIAQDIGNLCSSKNTNIKDYSAWTVKLLSPFVGFLREMVEMLPQWTQDYSVDDSDFTKEFQVSATPYNDALKAYIQYYKTKRN